MIDQGEVKPDVLGWMAISIASGAHDAHPEPCR